MKLTILCLCLSSFLFISCSKNENINDHIIRIDDETLILTPFGIEGTINEIVNIDDFLFINGIKNDKAIIEIINYRIHENDLEIINNKTISLNKNGAVIKRITAGGDGYLYIMIENDGDHIIQKRSVYNELINEISIKEISDELIIGLVVNDNNEILLYGSSFIILIDVNGNIIQKEKINSNHYILSVVLVNNDFVASVYDIHYQITRYYLINKTGLLIEFDNAVMNDERVPLEPYGWIESLGQYFAYRDPAGSLLNFVSENKDGFNRLGIITLIQNTGNKLLINDGFRFSEICFDTGEINLLHQWNAELHETNSCSSVIHLPNNIIIYVTNQSNYLMFHWIK